MAADRIHAGSPSSGARPDAGGTPQDKLTDDTDIDQKIGILLRSGIYAAAAVTMLGCVLFLGRHAQDRAAFQTFSMLPAALRSPVLICKEALLGNATGLMQLGMLLLIATPVARVAFSVAAFALRRDIMYVVISGIVLLVLAYSLIVH